MTSSRLSDDDIEAVFRVFDANHSGEIDREEMLYALKALGWSRVTESDIDQLFQRISASVVKQSLTFAEFKQFVREKQRNADSIEEIRLAFHLFDTTGRGKLSADDLRVAGKIATGRTVPDDLIDILLRALDKDEDGFLSFDEFAQAVVTKQEHAGGFVDRPPAPMQSELHRAPATVSEGYPALTVTHQNTEAVEVIAGAKITFTDGRVNKASVREALVTLGYDRDTMSDAQFDEMFADSDADGDGNLTRDEYCRLLVGFGEIVDGY